MIECNDSCGNGSSRYRLKISEDEVFFGTILVGNASPAFEITLENVGWEDILFQSLSITGPFTLARSNCPDVLKPGQKGRITVTFTPTAFGPWTGAVFIMAGRAGDHNIRLVGAAYNSNENGDDLSGIPIFLTREDLEDDANLVYPNGTYALVISDDVLANNDFYRKTGDSGESDWGEPLGKLSTVILNGQIDLENLDATVNGAADRPNPGHPAGTVTLRNGETYKTLANILGLQTTQEQIATAQALLARAYANADTNEDIEGAEPGERGAKYWTDRAETARAGAEVAASTAESAAGPTYPDTATGLAATTDGQSFAVDNGDGTVTVYLSNSGVAVEQRTLATTAALASTDAGKGASLVGTNGGGSVQDAFDGYPSDLPAGLTPAVLRTILLDAQVSRILSAAGDGNTDPAARTAETAKFQAMLDTGRSFDVPQPDVTYAVNQLIMHHGQEMRGYGRFGPTFNSKGGEFLFTGNGVNPTIVMGNGTGNPRRQALIGVSVINSNAPAVYVDNAPDWVLDRCRLFSSGNTAALRANYSYVASVTNCSIAVGGPGTGTNTWAVDLTDNVNGFTAIGNRVSGGSSGGAFRIGQSYQIALIQNIIESSLHGIWIASDNNTGGGNCNGVTLHGNNFEQCSTPYKLGTLFSVLGLSMSGGYVSNPLTTIVAARTACIHLGRVRGGKIFGMSLHPHSSEDLFWLWLENASANMVDLEVSNNTVTGTPNAAYALKGALAANASVRSHVGANCRFDFMGNGDPIGTNHVAEWTSPLIDASVSTGIQTIIDVSRIQMGGKILSAEIVDYNGGVLTGVALAIGRSGSITESVNVADMASLSFTNGRASLIVSVGNIFYGQSSLYRVTTAAGATGKFRIKIRYRAN